MKRNLQKSNGTKNSCVFLSWSCLTVLLLWMPINAQEYSCSDGRTDRASLLIYVFTPDRQNQDRRARSLEGLSRQPGWRGRIAAVRRTDTASVSGIISHDGAGATLCSAEGVVLRAIPQEYLLAEADDYLAFMDSQGVVSAYATEAFFDQILDGTLMLPISTDIDESTWGKIKVLFK